MASGVFDTCPLHLLAECMRDGKWLDVRTEEGVLQRVRIVEIVVRVRGEDVQFQQAYFDGSGQYRKHTFPIDSDCIWKVVPTNYSLEQVKPHGITFLKPASPTSAPDALPSLIIDTVGSYFGVPREDFIGEVACRNWKRLPERYVSMIVTYEMTDRSPLDIAKLHGYKSLTPCMSALQEVKCIQARTWEDKRQMFKSVREVAHVVDRLHGGMRFRRTAGWTYQYKPLLESPRADTTVMTTTPVQA